MSAKFLSAVFSLLASFLFAFLLSDGACVISIAVAILFSILTSIPLTAMGEVHSTLSKSLFPNHPCRGRG